ncbi:citrate synthase family protein [Silvimonas soli]|uniref:citrate synthase family protein n=1 Tax=Silvimonas soli TaxID=2980100 RepID=UPI0024B39416|nr:citrate synthase family protein [Silvimonas soli]
MDTSPPRGLIDARTATARLGISLNTLYAYVSRGLIRTAGAAADPRQRWYVESDISAYLARKQRQRRPKEAARTALDWGLPVLRTRITRIENQQLQYRGHDAIALAQFASLEEAAAILWEQPSLDWVPEDAPLPRLPGRLPALQRATVALALHAANKALPIDAPVAAQAMEGIALMRTVCLALGGAPGLPVHQALAQGWGRTHLAELIRRALVLCADHELNASTFAVRVTASTGASLAACLQAGLAALSGPRHGGMTEKVSRVLATLLDSADSTDDDEVKIDQASRMAELFGHPLYPDGDPRARDLLNKMPHDSRLSHLIQSAQSSEGGYPTLDLALVALERYGKLPAGSALKLFAMGRCVGWIAHVLEQRDSGQLIRPRAEFAGP